MKITVPGNGDFDIQNLLLDLNGTLCIDGKLVEGVKERIERLRNDYNLILLSGDTRGGAAELAKELGIQFQRTQSGMEKRKLQINCIPILVQQ